MATTAAIPIAIAPEAAERVAELGLTGPFGRMVEQVGRLVPGVIELRVMLVPDFEEGDEPAVVLHATVDARAGGDPSSWRCWREWLTSAYAPDIYRHFTLLTACIEASHAG